MNENPSKPVSRPNITNWHAVRVKAVKGMGEPEVERRRVIAHHKARQIADDKTWLPEERDREDVFLFFAWQLESIAVQLGPETFKKFEEQDHDTLGCLVVKWVEEGVII